jgi:hypothetical protein
MALEGLSSEVDFEYQNIKRKSEMCKEVMRINCISPWTESLINLLGSAFLMDDTERPEGWLTRFEVGSRTRGTLHAIEISIENSTLRDVVRSTM